MLPRVRHIAVVAHEVDGPGVAVWREGGGKSPYLVVWGIGSCYLLRERTCKETHTQGSPVSLDFVLMKPTPFLVPSRGMIPTVGVYGIPCKHLSPTGHCLIAAHKLFLGSMPQSDPENRGGNQEQKKIAPNQDRATTNRCKLHCRAQHNICFHFEAHGAIPGLLEVCQQSREERILVPAGATLRQTRSSPRHPRRTRDMCSLRR